MTTRKTVSQMMKTCLAISLGHLVLALIKNEFVVVDILKKLFKFRSKKWDHGTFCFWHNFVTMCKNTFSDLNFSFQSVKDDIVLNLTLSASNKTNWVLDLL